MQIKKEPARQSNKGLLILFMFLGAFIAGCDTLDDDTLAEDRAAIQIKEGPIVVTPQSSGIIDLNSLITASGNHRFAVTDQPDFGKLESLGNNLMQYKPNQGVTEAQDAFRLTIFGDNNVVLDEDTVTIIITEDSTAYPCGIYAFEDYVYDVDDVIDIDVLANDTACNLDISQVQVSIPEIVINGVVIPEAEFGTVEVLANKEIRYTPGPNYPGHDLFYYSITKPADGSNARSNEETSIALVYIIGPIQCDSLIVNNDEYIWHMDTLNLFDTLYLPVTANDIWCTREAGFTEIVRYPQGTITQASNDNGFYYVRPVNVQATERDIFRYRLCAGGGCAEAEVTILFE
jgi:hypothetical protein